MSLTIGVLKDHDFYVDDTRVVVSEIYDQTSFELHIPETGARHRITDQYAVEILPGVMVSAGNMGSMLKARMAIDAPRHIKIYRGELYTKLKGKGLL